LLTITFVKTYFKLSKGNKIHLINHTSSVCTFRNFTTFPFDQNGIKIGMNSSGSRGGRRGRSAPPKKKIKESEREGERSSVPLLSISAFIHTPVKCNKSLYIFTRCITLLVYLITFELLKQSTINQKTKWYYNPLDINFIKIHPFYKHFNTNYPIFNRETWENWLI
jgi:hypothetical protein